MLSFCNSESSISTSTSNHHKQPSRQPFKLTRFPYSHLQSSTQDFSPLSLLGKGSHGVVYRATLSTTTTVAVKKTTSSVADTAENEINILSNIRSRRIVNLIGYTVDSSLSPPKLLLVVEYMPNGSLYDYLHKHTKPPGLLIRVRFALQISKAVRTLHKSNPPVIHRDIKSSNVLIDERENARLSDFGLAIRAHVADLRVMSTPPAGTLGYLDPCYLTPGDLSTKSDVFSFGILLLEIISGRKAIDVDYSPPSIVEWALPLIKSGGFQGIVDRRILGGVDQTVVIELGLLAARCVRSTAEKRPPVEEIVYCLEKVYRRVKLQVFRVWRNFRRRVKRVVRSQPLVEFDGGDRTEGVTRGCRQPVRSRSKSMGAFREISKVGPEVAMRRGQLTMKISSVKLSKSRSMSMLYSGENGNNAQVKEVEVFPLLVKSKSSKNERLTIIEKSEKKLGCGTSS